MQDGPIDLSTRVYANAGPHHDSAAEAAVVSLPKGGGIDVVIRLRLLADRESLVVDDAAWKP